MSEIAARALAGRQERKGYLRNLIAREEGLTYQDAKGLFTKRFGVSHRTFSEYLADLQDEGAIYQKVDETTGLLLYWAQNGKAPEQGK